MNNQGGLILVIITVDILGGTGEVNGLDTADLLVGDGDDRTSLLGGGPDEVGGGDEGTALGGRGGDLTGRLATESLGETTRSHREERGGERCGWKVEGGGGKKGDYGVGMGGKKKKRMIIKEKDFRNLQGGKGKYRYRLDR